MRRLVYVISMIQGFLLWIWGIFHARPILLQITFTFQRKYHATVIFYWGFGNSSNLRLLQTPQERRHLCKDENKVPFGEDLSCLTRNSSGELLHQSLSTAVAKLSPSFGTGTFICARWLYRCPGMILCHYSSQIIFALASCSSKPQIPF